MAKTKKTSGKKKERVKELIKLGEAVTKMTSRNDELMTVAGINTFTKMKTLSERNRRKKHFGVEP